VAYQYRSQDTLDCLYANTSIELPAASAIRRHNWFQAIVNVKVNISVGRATNSLLFWWRARCQ
jgi:hypothetical protein